MLLGATPKERASVIEKLIYTAQVISDAFVIAYYYQSMIYDVLQNLLYDSVIGTLYAIHPFSSSRQAIASSSTLTASSMAITGRAWNSKAGKVEHTL